MKYTTVLFTLLAVATAAKLPNPVSNTDTVDVVARHNPSLQEGPDDVHGAVSTDEQEHEVEARRLRKSKTTVCIGFDWCNKHQKTKSKPLISGANALLNLDVGVLLAGLAGAGAAALL